MHALHRFIEQERLDIVGLQETHCSSQKEADYWNRDLAATDTFWSFGTIKQNGVAILLAARLHAKLLSLRRDTDGRLLSIIVRVAKRDYIITVVYCPLSSRERREFFDSSLEPLLSCPNHVVLGDFNTVLEPSLDRRSPAPARKEPAGRSLSRLFFRYSITDTFRFLHPSDPGFTWKRPNGKDLSRIDYILTSSELRGGVTNARLSHWQWSDHSLLHCTLAVDDKQSRGPGYWKMNVSILEDDSYVDTIRFVWQQWHLERSRFGSLNEWWEVGKAYFKDATFKHCQGHSEARR